MNKPSIKDLYEDVTNHPDSQNKRFFSNDNLSFFDQTLEDFEVIENRGKLYLLAQGSGQVTAKVNFRGHNPYSGRVGTPVVCGLSGGTTVREIVWAGDHWDLASIPYGDRDALILELTEARVS